MVTNSNRALWAAQGEADIRTIVDTARLKPGTSVFGAIPQIVANRVRQHLTMDNHFK